MRVMLALLLVASLSGCLSEESPAPEEPALDATPTVTSQPVDWTGEVSSHVCSKDTPDGYVCVVNGPGVAGTIGSTASNAPRYVHPAAGDLVGGELTLEWNALYPGTELLEVALRVVEGCDADGRNCNVVDSILDTEGSSPLTIDVPAHDVSEGQQVMVRILAGSTTETPDARHSIGQSVDMAGALDFVA